MSAIGIDIGTNSVVVTYVDAGAQVRWTGVEVTGLGRSLATAGVLAEADIERTVAAVERLLLEARSVGEDRAAPTPLRVVATAACRSATNAVDFLDRVETRLGVRPEVIGGDEEAALGFLGALLGIPAPEDEVLVIDIGGGSTELSLGKAGEPPTAHWSMPVGAVVLRSTELHHDPPRAEELTNAIGWAHDHLDDAIRAIPGLLSPAAVVGIAGTIVTTAAVEIGLAEWDEAALHGFVLSRDAVEDVFRTLATESLADRLYNPGLPADRADVIVAGLCILAAILRRLGVDELTVSTRGIAHGAASSLMPC